MNDWNQTDTLVILGLLLAFAIGSVWEPVVELVTDAVYVDNVP